MPTIRIGFSSDFILKNNTVGLGTTTSAHGKLDVDGTIKGNFSVTGVATLASYGGFVAQKQQIKKPSTIGLIEQEVPIMRKSLSRAWEKV